MQACDICGDMIDKRGMRLHKQHHHSYRSVVDALNPAGYFVYNSILDIASLTITAADFVLFKIPLFFVLLLTVLIALKLDAPWLVAPLKWSVNLAFTWIAPGLKALGIIPLCSKELKPYCGLKD
jgi:hypothetical protein